MVSKHETLSVWYSQVYVRNNSNLFCFASPSLSARHYFKHSSGLGLILMFAQRVWRMEMKRDFRQFRIHPYLRFYGKERSFSSSGEQISILCRPGNFSPQANCYDCLKTALYDLYCREMFEKKFMDEHNRSSGGATSNSSLWWESKVNGLAETKCVHNNTWSSRWKKQKKNCLYQVNKRESQLICEITSSFVRGIIV